MRRAVRAITERHHRNVELSVTGVPYDRFDGIHGLDGTLPKTVIEEVDTALRNLIEKLGVANERLCLVHLETDAIMSESAVREAIGRSCLFYMLEPDCYVLLYFGSRSVADQIEDLRQRFAGLPRKPCAKKSDQTVSLRCLSVWSHSVVDPLALLKELLQQPSLRIAI